MSLCCEKGCFQLSIGRSGGACRAHHLQKLNAQKRERAATRARNAGFVRARNVEERRQRKEDWERSCEAITGWQVNGFQITDAEYEALKKARTKQPKGRSLTRATPPWADKQAIREVYAMRDLFNRKYPKFAPFHVDHVIPIKGRVVCGLHVAENLTVIPAKENHEKLNKFAESQPRLRGTITL